MNQSVEQPSRWGGGCRRWALGGGRRTCSAASPELIAAGSTQRPHLPNAMRRHAAASFTTGPAAAWPQAVVLHPAGGAAPAAAPTPLVPGHIPHRGMLPQEGMHPAVVQQLAQPPIGQNAPPPCFACKVTCGRASRPELDAPLRSTGTGLCSAHAAYMPCQLISKSAAPPLIEVAQLYLSLSTLRMPPDGSSTHLLDQWPSTRSPAPPTPYSALLVALRLQQSKA